MPNTTNYRPPHFESEQLVDPDKKAKRPWQAWLSGSPVLVISILLHILLAILAAYFIVQRVQEKRKQNFSEVTVSPNSPAASSAKHQAQMTDKKNAMTTPDITHSLTVAELNPVSLPDVTLPADSSPSGAGKLDGASLNGAGLGEGAGLGGIGQGVQINTTAIAASVFGGTTKGLGLTGHFFDLKQKKNGESSGMDNGRYTQVVGEFVHSGWRRSFFRDYFVGPKVLYLPKVFIPYMSAEDGPKAFDLQDLVKPTQWVALYEGKIQVGHTGTYRFVGSGDDVLVVAINKHMVLDASWRGADGDASLGLPEAIGFHTPQTYMYHFPCNLDFDRFHRNNNSTTMPFPCGSWVEMEAGTTYDMSVLIGEHPGGACAFWLMVEEKDQTYQKTDTGAPILPPFKLGNVKMPPTDVNCPQVDNLTDMGWKLSDDDGDESTDDATPAN